MPPSRSSSTGRGRGGGGGRGRGRGRGMARSPGRGRGRGFAGARNLHVDEDVATEVNEFANESAGFFSDLTGVRRSAAPREEASTEQSVKEGSTLPAPGELLATKVVTGSEQTQDRVLWLELGLCKALIRAVTHLGFIAPTPVQAEAIPAALNGTDVCARAVTGSGKTAAFLLPLAHLLLTRPPQKSTMLNSKRRYIRAVILLPTRELGVQCESMLKSLLQFTTGLTVALAIGGVAPSAQEAALDAVPDILIATPGRLVDFLHNHKQGVDLTGVEVAVLDECDQMLNLNLKDQVLDVLERIPVETRQVLMFSATMTEEVDEFATEHLYKPRNVDIGHVALQAKLRQQFIRILDTEEKAAAEEEEPAEKTKRIRSKRLREEAKAASGEDAAAESGDARSKIKSRYLVALCQNYFKDQALIFCRYRTTVHRLAILFNALGLSASEIQGNQTQEERFAALEAFSSGKVHYLITTDVAARGLDILSVKTVINFDLPPSLTAYIHRVGRTARIGTSGTAVSLVHEVEDSEIMRRILAVSGAIHEHQVASVKRRDVPADLLKKAMMDIDRVFPEVRGQLQAEQLEERIALAEKRFGRKKDAVDPVTGQITVRAKKEWCLSKAEKNRRDEEARLAYEKEAEVTVNRFQNELSTLEREESSILQKMKVSRRNDREKKNREKEKLKEKAKELRRKAEKKVQAGVVKKLKKQKIRASIRERRADEREKKGHAPFKHGDGRKSNKKSRHRKRIKRH